MKSKRLMTIVTIATVLLSTSCIITKVSAVSLTSQNNNIVSERIAGEDRYKTSVEISKKGWIDGAENIIIASGENYADALCAAPLSKAKNAPILLTEKDKLSNEVLQEIKRLNAKQIIIIGGEASVSKSLEDLLKTQTNASIERIWGQDRYETAVNVASTLGKTNDVIIASGENYPDALSAAPVAAAKGMPVILSDKEKLPDSVVKYISNNHITKTYVVGGTASISENVEKSLPLPERLAGSDRYETNRKVIERFNPHFDFHNVYVALADGPTGKEFADALAGAGVAGKQSAPIILSENNLASDAENLIKEKLLPTSKTTILGGDKNISDSAVENLKVGAQFLDKKGETYSNSVEGNVDVREDNVTVKGNINGNLYIEGNNTIISSITVKGTVYVNPGEKGICNLDSLKADKIVILSGDNVKLANVSTKSLSIQSRNKTKLDFKKCESIENTDVLTSAILDVNSGSLGAVKVADIICNDDSVEFRGLFNKTLTVCNDSNINIASGATVYNVILPSNVSGKDVQITGAGKIGNVYDISKDSSLNVGKDISILGTIEAVAKDKVKSDNDSTIKKINEKAVDKMSPLYNPVMGGGSSGGGSSSGGSSSTGINESTVGLQDEVYLNDSVSVDLGKKITSADLQKLSITITDRNNNAQSLTAVLSSDGQTLSINPPNSGYDIGESYQLVVKNTDGNNVLSSSITKTFSTLKAYTIKNHVWTFTALKQDNLSGITAQVVDSKGIAIPVKLSINGADVSVTPQNPYTENQDYILYMKDSSGREIRSIAFKVLEDKTENKIAYNYEGIFLMGDIGQGVTVNSDNVMLIGSKVNGSVIVSEKVGDGTVKFKRITTDGVLKVHGGGAHSVRTIQCSFGKIEVDDEKNTVRVVVEGNTSVGSIEMKSGGILKINDGSTTGDVNISYNIPENATVVLDGNFGKVTSDAANVKINVADNATITELNINAAASVTGNGTIKKATINAGGTTFEKKAENVVTPPYIKTDKNDKGEIVYKNINLTISSVAALGSINVSNGTSQASIGLPTSVNITLSDGTTVSAAVTWDGASPTYNGSTAGSYTFVGTITLPEGVANPNNVRAVVNVVVANPVVPPTPDVPAGEIKVTDLSLDKTAGDVKVGESVTLTATVLPKNATNKQVQWSSSDESVAIVNNGIVTVTKMGQATISAKSADGSKIATFAVNGISNGKPAEELHMYEFNDFHGQIDKGYDETTKDIIPGNAFYLASYLKNIRNNDHTSIIIEAGDAFGASSAVSALRQDEPTVEILNSLGIDLGVPGNHEFDEGSEEFLRMVKGGDYISKDPDFEGTQGYKGMDFPILAANIVDKNTNKLLFKPYMVKQVGDTKIGFIGICGVEASKAIMPGGIQSIAFLEEAPAINKAVKELNAQGVHSIVVVTHMSPKEDGGIGALDLANLVDDDVDLIIAAHDHKHMEQVVDNKLVLESDGNGADLSDIKIQIKDNDITFKDAEIKEPQMADNNAEIKSILDKYANKLKNKLTETLGSTKKAMDKFGTYSALGNFIADGMRWSMPTDNKPADFALLNGSGLRTSLNAGMITWGEIFNVEPFGNKLVKFEITGADLEEILNAQLTPQANFNISGFTYSYAGGKVKEIKLPGGKAIDKNAKYTLVVNEYMATSPETKYQKIGQLGKNQVVGPTDRQSTIDYIKSFNNVEIDYNPGTRITEAVTPQPTSSVQDALKKKKGDAVTVEGIITAVRGENKKYAYLQDDTAAITLYSKADGADFNVGDKIKVTGKIDIYNGLIEIKGYSVDAVISTTNIVQPTNISIDKAKDNVSKLITIKNVKLGHINLPATPTDNTYTEVSDGTNKINILNIPALNGIGENDMVDIKAIVDYYNKPQLIVLDSSWITKNTDGALLAAEAAKYADTAAIGADVAAGQDITNTIVKLKEGQTKADSVQLSYEIKAGNDYLEVKNNTIQLKAQKETAGSATAIVKINFVTSSGNTVSKEVTVTVQSSLQTSLTLTSQDVAWKENNNKTKLTIVEALGQDNKRVYKNYETAAATEIKAGDILTDGWAVVPVDGVISASNGDTITVAEVDGDNKAVKFSNVTASVQNVLSIEEAKKSLNQSVVIEGIITSIADKSKIYMQDETAGINLFNQKSLDKPIGLGNKVEVSGKLINNKTAKTDYGLQLRDFTVNAIDTNSQKVQAKSVSIQEVLSNAAKYEGEFVKFDNVKLAKVNKDNTPIEDSTDSTKFINIYKCPTLSGMKSGDSITVKAIVNLFNGAPQLYVGSAEWITNNNPALDTTVTITSTVYDVTSTTTGSGIITGNVNTTTTVGAFLLNLTKGHPKQVIKIFAKGANTNDLSNAKQDNDTMANEDVVLVIAEDPTKKAKYIVMVTAG